MPKWFLIAHLQLVLRLGITGPSVALKSMIQFQFPGLNPAIPARTSSMAAEEAPRSSWSIARRFWTFVRVD